MFMREADLFQGAGHHTIEEIAMESTEQTFRSGDVIFREGDQADALYVLAEGNVEISVGERGAINFIVGRPGEVFGWAALVEPYVRTGTAACTTDTKLLRVPSEVMERVMKKYPEDGLRIMRHLTGVLVQRLRIAYQAASSESDLATAAATPSYG
jgi:CRP-like cAMP-binding protein